MSNSTPGPSRAPADSASRTQTITPTPSNPSNPDNQPPDPRVGVLKLRGGPSRRQKVAWTDETVDNEGMGKKKSKICCIYHRPKAFDESSESSSGSEDESTRRDVGRSKSMRKKRADGEGEIEESSESEGGAGDGRARPVRKPKKHSHKHHHNHDCDKHPPKANKYDTQPKPDSGGGSASGNPSLK